MKDSRVLSLFVFVVLASFLTGCARTRQFQKVREEYPYKLRVVVNAFQADSQQIFLEDVANLSDYYRDKLEETGLFSIERDSDVISRYSRPGVLENVSQLRKLSKNNLIEGVISGTIKKYYYKKERRYFHIALALDISVHDTYSGEEIFHTSKNYNKKFRLSRKGQKDYSKLNQQLLDLVLGQINHEMIVEVSKIIEKRRAENGGEFTVVMNGSETQNLLLWPKDAIQRASNGNARIGALPTPNIRSLASVKPGDNEELEIENLSIDLEPRRKAITKNSKMSKADLLDMGFDSILDNRKNDQKKSKNFHLKVQGFKLIYPLEWDSSKKYSKFYYLVDSKKYKNKDIVDIDASMEDNLVLEIFSTVDGLAVRRFLEDYFQGINSHPIGDILEVFERNYMGKLQLGFVLGDKAVIASIHRKHRATLLQGLTSLYIKNGGVSVEKLVNESIRRRFSSNSLVLDTIAEKKKVASMKKAKVKPSKKKTKKFVKSKKKVKAKKVASSKRPKVKKIKKMPKTI
ncbi:hypothetical protein MJH12_03195, partial [bacterium]|nr:hypothetical protein [bacterium]